MHDRHDTDQSVATPVEGVRILGAEEAQAAIMGVGRAGIEQPRLDLVEEERNEERRIVFPERGPSWSAVDDGDVPAVVPSASDEHESDGDTVSEPTTGEVPPLPHWTEPPTGAVPAIFADDPTGEQVQVDDDLDAWASITGSQPRFRAEGADWADSGLGDDFAEELTGEHERLGALDEETPADVDEEFAEAVAARRRPARARRGAARPARPTPPRPTPSEPVGPTAARDLPVAIMSAGAMACLALACFWWSTTATALLACVVIGFASLEFCNTLQRKAMRPATLLAFVASLTVPIAAKHYGTGALPVYFGMVVIFSMLWFLWQVTPGRPLLGVMSTVGAFAYVGGLGAFAGLLLSSPDGVGLLIGVALCSISYDVIGFFVGSQFGRTRIAPNISPNKTVAGTVGGVGASIIVGTLIAGAIHPWTHSHGFVLGVFVGLAAFLGDLCESMIKRDLGVKDFGALLPGHGGVLDRFDGLLFSLPVAYYLALHWHLF